MYKANYETFLYLAWLKTIVIGLVPDFETQCWILLYTTITLPLSWNWPDLFIYG